MEQERAEAMAREAVKAVVDLLSQKKYEEISMVAEMDILSTEDTKELVNEYLELNNLSHIDCFDVGCNFHPSYEYQQMEFYHFNYGSGFAVDYALTTDRELNDLTLQMEFLYDGENTLKARLLDLHVL